MSRSTSVTAAPVLQLAADGQWETAQVVTAGPVGTRTVVEQVARAARDDIAVEILWPTHAFVGVRWPADSWEKAAAAIERSLDLPSLTVETGLLALLGTTPGTEVEFVELGAVNAWRSIGPERLWRRGETRQDIGSALVRRPDLATCPHPLAVELAVATPQPCWIGVYVATGSLEDILAAVI